MRQDWGTTLRLVLLATAGNHTEARALLADYPAHHGGPGAPSANTTNASSGS